MGGWKVRVKKPETAVQKMGGRGVEAAGHDTPLLKRKRRGSSLPFKR